MEIVLGILGIYLMLGAVLYFISLPTFDITIEEEIGQFFYYLVMWPRELYLMITYNPNEVEWEDIDE